MRTFFFLFMAISLAGCVSKPTWWPDERVVKKGTPLAEKVGVKWPPPKPEGWKEKHWPPTDGRKDDPGFWAKYFREYDEKGKRVKIDPHKPNEFETPNVGQSRFVKGFPDFGGGTTVVFTPNNILVGKSERKKACGLFQLLTRKSQDVASCNLNAPLKTTAKLCREITAKTAKKACLKQCATNTKKCRRGVLYPPAVHVAKYCLKFKNSDEHWPKPAETAFCDKSWVCACYEI